MLRLSLSLLLVKSFREATEISSVAQRTMPRTPNNSVDHLAVDVSFLAATAGRFTRDMVGFERNEEAVKIVTRLLTTNILRRMKVKKSVCFLMDGTDPLWKVQQLRQYPGKTFDRIFYRSAASPMVYQLENAVVNVMEEMRGSSQVVEAILSGPGTPGPTAAKMSAWLLDLHARACVPPTQPSAAATVTVQDSIVLIGNPADVHLNAWGCTPWGLVAAPSANTSLLTTVSLDQRDTYSLPFSDSMEWLGMSDLLTAVTSQPHGQQKVETLQALAAARTDAVLLYLLGFGSPAVGLPPLTATITFAQWMAAYAAERERAAPAAVPSGPLVSGRLMREYPRTAGSCDLAPLRLAVDGLHRLIASALPRLGGGSSSSGRPNANVAHYLEVLLHCVHAYTHGYIPNLLYFPADAKALFGEKGMKGVTIENVVSHLHYLSSAAGSPSASGLLRRVGSSTELAVACERGGTPSRPAALTGAQQLCLSSTQPEYMNQALHVFTRGHAPPAKDVAEIIAAKTVKEALPMVQDLIPPQHSGPEAGKEPMMDAGLRCCASHFVTRSAPLAPWKYQSIHLGLRSEVLNSRCCAVVGDAQAIPPITPAAPSA